MERFTANSYGKRAKAHSELCKRHPSCSQCPQLQGAMQRLAHYEDTGMEPDEIVKMGMAWEDSKRYSGRLELKLKRYEDMEEQGRLVVLPCGTDAELVKDGKIFKADHWNHTLTAFRENPATPSGRQVALFSIENAENALKGGAK